MKNITSQYKDEIYKFGRQIDCTITYSLNGETIELGKSELNSVAPHYQGGILKSVMKQLDIDSNTDIPLGTILNCQFGVLIGNYNVSEDETYQDNIDYYSYTNNVYTLLIKGTDYNVGDEIENTVYNYSEEYEYISYGNYVVYSSEKQEDTLSYKITCYDKMLYSMVDYANLGITYPITIRNYINAICTHLGLTFANASDTFANYDRQIQSELYLDTDGNSLDYTFRDVLDELAQVTASTICINDNDQLEIRYINDTEDTIDAKYLKDINVNFGEKYGPVNSIVLSRASESDNVYLRDEESVEENGLCEIKIKENQIMNFNDRSDYLPDLLQALDGLEYYLNDFSSTGITYYELCDKYNITIDDNTYSCVMFNDEVNITQGLKEIIHTDRPKESETDYKKADKTDRRINQTYIIVDKQNQVITSLANEVGEYDDRITTVEQTVDRIEQNAISYEDLKRNVKASNLLHIENAYPNYPLKFSIKNASLVYPSNNLYPSNYLYPIGTLYLVVDKTQSLSEDAKFIELPIKKLYSKDNVYDEFVVENKRAYIIHRIGVNQDESTYILENEVSEELGTIEIPLFEGDNYFYLYAFQNNEGVIYEIDYTIPSAFTDAFATEVYVDSSITQTANQIMLQVDEKVDEEEIIAKLNVAVEDGQGIINLVGNTVTIDSDNFKLDVDGKIEATAGDIGGFEIDGTTFSAPLTTLIRMWNGEEYVDTELEIFTSEDIEKVRNYIAGTGTLTPEELIRYDVNNDGVVDISDMALMIVTTYYNINTDNPGRFLLNTTSATNVITFYDKDENERVNLGLYNFIMQSADGSKQTQINFNGVSSPAFNNNSLESLKKNIKKYDNAIDIIKKSDIYSYNWKNEKDTDKKHYGLVIGDKYNTPDEFISNDGKGIDTYAMVSICLKAIKEQQEEIELLKKEIKLLKEEK